MSGHMQDDLIVMQGGMCSFHACIDPVAEILCHVAAPLLHSSSPSVVIGLGVGPALSQAAAGTTTIRERIAYEVVRPAR